MIITQFSFAPRHDLVSAWMQSHVYWTNKGKRVVKGRRPRTCRVGTTAVQHYTWWRDMWRDWCAEPPGLATTRRQRRILPTPKSSTNDRLAESGEGQKWRRQMCIWRSCCGSDAACPYPPACRCHTSKAPGLSTTRVVVEGEDVYKATIRWVR